MMSDDKQPVGDLPKLYENARVIFNAADKYEGDIAIAKYAILLAHNEANSKPTLNVDSDRIRKRFPLNEEQLRLASAHAAEIVKTYREQAREQVRNQPQEQAPAPEKTPEQIAIENEAMQVLKGEYKEKDGKVVPILEYFMREYRRRHTQDELTQTIMLCAAVCPHVSGSFGIFPKASGEKQSGKSSSIYASACQIHPDFVLFASLSGKGLYYNPIREGMIIISDDAKPSDDMIELMKKKMSSEYHKVSQHLTVDGNREGTVKTIPAGVVFVLTSVTDSKSDQLVDRQWILPTDKNSQTDDAYSKFLLDNAKDGFKGQADTKETAVCWEISRILKTTTFDVAIPFADSIQFTDEAKNNRRAENNFIDLIRCHAAIFHKQRTLKDGVIQATIVDFNFALTTMGYGEQRWSAKLTKSEEVVWNMIVAKPGISQVEISEIMGRSEMRVSQILHGEDKDSGGLADKAPLQSEKVYNRDTGKYSICWKAVATLNRTAIFATLKPE